MSLFKSKILNAYNILCYDGEYLILHCSRNDFIYVPFDGKLKITDDGCILYNKDFELHLSHMQCTMHDDVKACKNHLFILSTEIKLYVIQKTKWKKFKQKQNLKLKENQIKKRNKNKG